MARILVIDDDTSLLQMMSLMLKRAGHDPILANDGREGIEIAREQLPDLAVVDIMMPDLTGHEVCRIMRQDPTTTDIPLLILTALSQHDQREIAAEAGADDFVTKPVTRDDLVGRVEGLLRSGPRNYPVPLVEENGVRPAAHARVAAEPEPPVAEVLLEEPPAPRQPAERRAEPLPFTAVMGLTSGVGATTLAVNLALALAESRRTCLVDLHPYNGRAAIQMRMMPPRATWRDLLDVPPGAEKREIGSALSFDKSRGIALLAAPVQPAARMLSGEQLEYIISVLSEAFPRIIVSLPAEPNEMSNAALCMAQRVMLVVGEDPTDLLAAKEHLADVHKLGVPGEISVVLNRTRPHGVSYDDVAQAINRPLVANVPYEPGQVEAVTDGVPLILSRPDSLFAQTVRQLARQL